MPLFDQKYRIRRISIVFRFLWRKNNYFLRALLCWGIGLLVLNFNEHESYDLRYNLRGSVPPTSPLLIVTVTQSDWNTYFKATRPFIRPTGEIYALPDSFYWNLDVWTNMLAKLLEAGAKGIGITFFFGDNLIPPKLTAAQQKLFFDPRIIWSANLDNRGRVLRPFFSNPFGTNIGLSNLQEDEDGVIRRFSSPIVGVPHFSARLTQIINPSFSHGYLSEKKVINFFGASHTFQTITLDDLFSGRITPNMIQDKLVLVGSEATNHRLITPVGALSEAELQANVVENTIRGKWIRHLDDKWYALFLFLLLLLSLVIINRYPQSVALIFILWVAALIGALSVWFFDSFNVWWPGLSPLIQLFATWFVFVDYHARLNEKINWRLRQEQQYLMEVEQLKNNFVSLISHDLKTPIAKIQAIVDRLLAEQPHGRFVDDLLALRKSSEELHRYIGSILKVVRVQTKESINKTVADINELIESAIAQLEPLAHEKSISIEKSLEPLFSMELDATLIQEVILNLIDNAIKYTPKGGKIVVVSRELDDEVTVLVKDNGAGIAANEQEEVWRKFVRAKEHSATTKGSGLGLYLVKYFVELHGGTVHLTSRLNEGTTVGFSLPLSEETKNDEVNHL